MEEIWKPWAENDAYQISNLGNVRGIKGFNLKTQVSSRGYITVNLRKKDCRNANRYDVHLLVLRTFNPIDETQIKYVGDHIDGNRNNNTINNLRWVTPAQNNEFKNENRKPIQNIINNLINQHGYEKTLELLQTLIK